MPSLSHYCRPHLWAAVLAFGLAAASALAQSAVSVTDAISTWNPWRKADLTIMGDPSADQQTGQGQDDFVSDATNAAFFQKAGTIGGVDHLLFRARFNKFDGVDTWGNGGNLGIGVDVDGDGAVDLLIVMTESSGSGRTRTITFGDPGTGTNTSPSTTTWTFPTQTAISLTAGTSYSTVQADTSLGSKVDADSFVSFAVSFANLQSAVRTWGGFASFTMNYSTMLSFVAFTSTTNNALNQDLLGATGNTTSATTWTALGAMSAPMDAFGVVPEPATYAQMAALLLAGGVVAWRRRRARSSAAGPVPVE